MRERNIDLLSRWHAVVYLQGDRVKAGKILRIIDRMMYEEQQKWNVPASYITRSDVATNAVLGGWRGVIDSILKR